MPSRRVERSLRSGVSWVLVGACCVGTPTEEEELRKVLAGAGAASLDPDELILSGMGKSTLIAAAAARCIVRPEERPDVASNDSDLVRLIAAGSLEQCEAYR